MFGRLSHHVYDRILKRLRECVRSRNYIVTLDADEEMAEEGISILDVERAKFEGRIIERQKDENRTEWKYLVAGPTRHADSITAVTKIGSTGKMILITVFGDDSQG